MKVLVVGLGPIGLGLISLIFREAGNEVVGTDADPARLQDLEKAYRLVRPNKEMWQLISVVPMNSVTDEYDLIVTCVGRRNLPKVAEWYHQKGLSAPVILAENLPDPVNLFPNQIPMVVDRICPRVEKGGDGYLAVYVEEHYKVITLDHGVTQSLQKLKHLELKPTVEAVEAARRLKLYTVNTAHVVTAYYGQKLGAEFVEQAIAIEEVRMMLSNAICEVAPWLGIPTDEQRVIVNSLIGRFSATLNDPVARIVGDSKRASALEYIRTPLEGLRARGFDAPVLEEVLNGLDPDSP